MFIKFLDGTQKEIADLTGADLAGADLTGANFTGADLRGADLTDADLAGTDLTDANLTGAKLTGAKRLATFNIVAQGALRVWKKLANDVIAELEIPVVALRVNAYGSRKCRADLALVISLSTGNVAYGCYDDTFAYRVGETVTPKEPFCADPRIECASGIHFFITKEEAMEY